MINVVQVGVGPLGQRMVKFARERKDLQVVAAVDPAADKSGKDLGTLCGLEPLGVTVSADLPAALKGERPDVALLATVSSIAGIESQIAGIAECGLSVVSTCEELSFPWQTAPEIAQRIDALCRRRNVACLGTGVNPGFLMDFLPSVLTGVCQKVEKVTVHRVQDASKRRIPFQQKIGAGLTLDRFEERRASGALRHVGLTESIHMIAHALGWSLDRTTETLEPVVAREEITTGYAPITPGTACGVEQIGKGYVGKKVVIVLHFRAAVGEPKSYDRIEIAGEPPVRSTIEGGVNGDVATCAVTLNAIRPVLSATPGLRTMLDIKPCTALT